MKVIIKQNATTNSVTVDGKVFDMSTLTFKEREKFRVELVRGLRELGVVGK